MKHRSIGYLGLDVLNNATICNEALGLIEAGTPLEIVSIQRIQSATFFSDRSLSSLIPRIHALYPLGLWSVLGTLAMAPYLFGINFWRALVQMATCPVEGWRQRARLIWRFIPSLCLARHWKQKNIGHIHAHWAHTATTVAMHTAKLLGIGFSFTGHANDLFVHRVALAGKLRRARFTVSISEFHKRFYLSLGADSNRLPIVYCGIDTDRFGSQAAPVTSTRPRIVAVGRLVEKKGFHYLIRACSELKARGHDFECIIAGSGPELDRLRWLVDCLGLGDVVRLTGTNVLQEDLEQLLRSATAVVLPCVRDRQGDMDGLPQVLIEAMVCGKPVISTKLVGIPDLVRDGWNGLLVPPEESDALGSAIERLLCDPQAAATMGLRANFWARQHFSRKETVRRLLMLFTAACATPCDTPLLHSWHEMPRLGPAEPKGFKELKRIPRRKRWVRSTPVPKDSLAR